MNSPDLGAHKDRHVAHASAGFTLVENAFAMAIVGLFFVALYALNTQCVYMLNSGREAATAEQSEQDRLEQLRNCTWAQLTDASYLRDNVLSASTTAARNLGLVTETVTVNAYPIGLNPAISVVRSNGTATAASSNPSIANTDIVRVDLALNWKAGPGGRSRTQAVTTLIAQNNP
jgi:Tfp pilus assembly protein PilE